jgi:hypothetical protein
VGTLFLSPDEPYEVEEEDVSEGGEETEEEASYHPTLEEQFVEAELHTYAHHHKHPFFLSDDSLSGTLRRDEEEEEEESPEEEIGPLHPHHHHKLLFHRSRSFFQSKQAIQSGNETAVKLMSLKDQPFWIQFKSATFARAVLIFVTTSFLANFTIASINTELVDLEHFGLAQQHSLSQQFTVFMSLGILYAVLVGWLMDRAGLEVCTFITLLLGQISSLLMLLASSSSLTTEQQAYTLMVISFVVYSLFRAFLFPVFLAYITARLGFKYFGILSGIAFAASGVAQCFMANLVALVHDHIQPDNYDDGRWRLFHGIQIGVLAIMMVIPIADHRDIQRRQAQMEQALKQLQRNNSSLRGSINSQSPRSIATTSVTSTTTSPLLKDQERDIEYGSTTLLEDEEC